MISMLIGGAIILLCVLLDQLTKAWAVVGLSGLPGQKLWVIEDVFSFSLCYNKGAAFSSFSGQYWFLMAITAVACVVFGFLFVRLDFKKAKLYSIAVPMMIGGMLGNFIDRTYSHFSDKLEGVVDFLSFDLINFAVFNVADSFLVVGIILFIIDFLFLEPRREKDGKSLFKRK